MIGWSRRLLMLCGLWPALALAVPSAALHAPRFLSIGDDEVIPESVVSALAQDRAGFIWIGTPVGLIRYDGYRFRRFEHRPGDAGSLAGNQVRSLLALSDGRLLIGTDADGLSIYDPQQERFESLQHDPADRNSLAAGPIFAMVEDLDGTVWLSSRGGGLQRYKPSSQQIRRYRMDDQPSSGLGNDHVTELLLDRRGRLWVGTAQGLYRMEADGRLRTIAAVTHGAVNLAQEMVFTLHEAADGQIWLATRGGELILLDPDSEALRRIDDGSAAGGEGSIVYDIREVQPGELWLARSDGIEIRDPNGRLLHRLRHDPSQPGGLAGHDVRALLLDHSGLLWVAGYGLGLQRHDPRQRAIAVLRGPPGSIVLADPNVSALLASMAGELWLGTRGGGMAVLDAKLDLAFEVPAASSAVAWVTSFAEAADGSIWIGSREGLFQHRRGSGELTLVPTWHGAAGQVRRMLIDRDGALWIGGAGGLLRRTEDGQLQPQQAAEGRLEGDINAIVEDHAGRLWVGSSMGLWVRATDQASFVRVRAETANPPLPASIFGLLVDRSGTLWVDTAEGLYRRTGNDEASDFEAITAAVGAPRHAFGASLLDDAQGRLWSAHNLYDPKHRRIYPLGRADGVDIGTPWFRSYTRSSDGRLWFGGSKGVLVIDPKQFRAWDFEPPVVLTDLRIDGRPPPLLAGGHALTLAPPQRQFAVEFAALDYSANGRLDYRYRLHGYDDDWVSSADGNRVASYGNLWPGNYLLEVQGSNRLGTYSPHTLKLPVQILPAFWQRPLFALLLVFALLLAVYAATRWRSAQAERRARQLQALVDQRTIELRRAKERAEGTLQQLQSTQKQLVAAEKMASLGQLVAGVAHEINTPIGIAVTAASHLQEVSLDKDGRFAHGRLSRSDFQHWRESVQEGMRLVLASLERAHTLIASFKQVAVDQSSEQRRRFLLQQFLEEVRFALQPSYRRAGHDLQIECP